jgi:hypothetical protein
MAPLPLEDQDALRMARIGSRFDRGHLGSVFLKKMI